MDFKLLYAQTNERFQEFLQRAKLYFSNLSRMEMYGWGVMGFGLVLFIVGFVLWL